MISTLLDNRRNKPNPLKILKTIELKLNNLITIKNQNRFKLLEITHTQLQRF